MSLVQLAMGDHLNVDQKQLRLQSSEDLECQGQVPEVFLVSFLQQMWVDGRGGPEPDHPEPW